MGLERHQQVKQRDQQAVAGESQPQRLDGLFQRRLQSVVVQRNRELDVADEVVDRHRAKCQRTDQHGVTEAELSHGPTITSVRQAAHG